MRLDAVDTVSDAKTKVCSISNTTMGTHTLRLATFVQGDTMNKKFPASPRVAVVIATRNRSEMLSERSLPSVLVQTRTPNFVVVVDDSSEPSTRLNNAKCVREFSISGCEVTYLENARTQGASGAWNTAFDFLFAKCGDVANVFVAILDDDDAWHPEYLESCCLGVVDQQLDMVACGLRRIEDGIDAVVESDAPDTLSVEDFLTGNPGIQGSNLFVRLSVLFAAGGFDEHLLSTTDRDLCIRIAELSTVRYGKIPRALVDHYADAGRQRLSTPSSVAKLQGLSAFWTKYVARMTYDQRLAFTERASKLFGWMPPNDVALIAPVPAVCQRAAVVREPTSPERLADAEQCVRRRFSLSRLRLLGCGTEAVVFTDEHAVFKCIDYWKTRMPRSQLDFLQGQVGRWTDVPGLYVLRSVVDDGILAIITYDYEPSTPYAGGHEADLIGFLNGACTAGIVCNNVHPKNLVVTRSGVKLIDYGSDIRPWTALGFEHMARKAFVACRYAAHPELSSLMQRVLSDDELPEMAGYPAFRAQVGGVAGQHRLYRAPRGDSLQKAPIRPSFQLYVGVITSEPWTLSDLLDSLVAFDSSASVRGIAVLVLDNGCPPQDLETVVQRARVKGLKIAIVDEARQRSAAAEGAFGDNLRERPAGQVGIAFARTMIQKYLGALLAADTGAFGWLLDDDMRVDAQAHDYLPWLPVFHEEGTDVLVGAYEGSSPNPPINGIRVQLVDLLHNLHWLRSLPADSALPSRAAENEVLRARYPDYYYDLSRVHTAHLEMPHWLEPAGPGETVKEAYSRLLHGAIGLLSGAPLTRPLIAAIPSDPLLSAKDSTNRGGCTFILNSRSLSETPNTMLGIHGREARRSDMVWAIVNRHYRHLVIKAVGFPVHHVARSSSKPRLDTAKVQAEIVGSTLYAGLTDFLRTHPQHELEFSCDEVDEVYQLANTHLARRWKMLAQNFHRIAGLCAALRCIARTNELTDLFAYLDEWFTPESFERLRAGMDTHDKDEIRRFLKSLRPSADGYAIAPVNIDFINVQWEVNQ